MVETPNRRRAARVTVPAHLGPFELELRLAQLLDLSAEGVRIEHLGHLHEGLRLFIDLPPDLGGGRLTGEVVWTRLRKGEQTLEGDRFVYYQSGIAFIGITPEQQAALAVALAILKRDEPPAGA